MSTRDETSHPVKPAVTSAAVATTGTVGVVLVLLWQVDDVAGPVALGAVGAVLFGVSCWLLSQNRFETVSPPLVSVLTLPVAVGLFGSGALAGLLLASSLFPVEDGSLFSTTTLIIAGHVGVVFGSVLALLGLVLGTQNVVTPTTLRRYSITTLFTALVPGLVSLALIAEVIVFQDEGPLSVSGEFVTLTWTWLTASEPTGLDLTGFLFVAGLAIVTARTALVALPIDAVLDTKNRTDMPDVDRLISRLAQVAGVVIVCLLCTLPLELYYSEADRLSLLGPTLDGFLELFTTARILRFAFLTVAVVAGTAATAGYVTRRVARQSLHSGVRIGGAFVGGALITLIAFLVSEPVYETLLSLVLDSLPVDTAADFEEMATESAYLYGEETFAIALAFAFVATTLCFVLVIRLALLFGYLSDAAPGYTLASAGLFLGVVAAGTLDAPIWLVFGGVLCSLLVWDAGRFGTTLGRELGPNTTTRFTELVHLGATLLVGLVGVLAGTVLVSRVDTVWRLPSATTSVALVVLAVGLVSFVVALR